MSKKIVRITESDLVKIVKKIINEQGGYDDPLVMSVHSGRVLGGLNNIVDAIIDMLSQSLEAISSDIPKKEMLEPINKMSQVLDIIEDKLSKINPEVMLNRDLKNAVFDLEKEVKKAKSRLMSISSYNKHYYDPEMRGSLTGSGFSMSDKELNDKLSEILLRVSHSAEKLAFQLKDETNNMYRRFDNLK